LQSIHPAIHETTSNLICTADLFLSPRGAARSHHSNAFFARVGGVSNAEMNKLEMELLDMLDFAVAVDHRAYARYREHLEKEMRRDHHRGLHKPPAVKPVLPPLAEERPAESADDSDHDRNKPLPNGCVPPPANMTSLRELWAVEASITS
jgi:hypothetical protein